MECRLIGNDNAGTNIWVERFLVKNEKKKLIQWMPLKGITVNGINWLMGSNECHLTNPKIPFPTL